MAKKEKQKRSKVAQSSGRYDNKTYRDLKIDAIKYGMPFPDVIASGIGDLISYIETNCHNKPDRDQIERFDDWMKEQLAMVNIKQPPSLRLSYVSDENCPKERKKEKVPKEKKVKRERDELNFLKGTKKSYTFELTRKGFSIERVIRRVLKKFPEASDKSIRIWYNKAKKM